MRYLPETGATPFLSWQGLSSRACTNLASCTKILLGRDRAHRPERYHEVLLEIFSLPPEFFLTKPPKRCAAKLSQASGLEGRGAWRLGTQAGQREGPEYPCCVPLPWAASLFLWKMKMVSRTLSHWVRFGHRTIFHCMSH